MVPEPDRNRNRNSAGTGRTGTGRTGTGRTGPEPAQPGPKPTTTKKMTISENDKKATAISHERITIDVRRKTRQESPNFSNPTKRRRQMHRVLPQLRLKKHHIEHIYDPAIVSLGPYHHGSSSQELRQAEDFKPLCVKWFTRIADDVKEEDVLYRKITEKIDAVRSSYADASALGEYSDGDLAGMMLRDACFVVNYMANVTSKEGNNVREWQDHFGMAAFPFMLRDIMKLENQIPFSVIKLLVRGNQWNSLLHDFLNWLLLRDGSKEQVRVPREDEDPPLHLLEALWRAVTNDEEEDDDEPIKETPPTRSNRSWRQSKLLPRFLSDEKKAHKKDEYTYTQYHSQRVFRSVMDLRAKGVYFSPSSSYSLKAVRFRSSSYYGELQLPVRYVSDQHQVMLSNLIAYELSPDSSNEKYIVLSYAILMKSLIESAEDVKELQKRGILFNKYSNHEQVVKAFKDIDTFGLVNFDVFRDVKEKIGEHCRDRKKTWTADLIHTRLNSPWSVLALFAATFLLCLTALQTFYAVNYRH